MSILPQPTTPPVDVDMFDEQQDYIRSLERPPGPADPLGASAFPSSDGETGDVDMGIGSEKPVELGFGERFSKEEEEVCCRSLCSCWVYVWLANMGSK